MPLSAAYIHGLTKGPAARVTPPVRNSDSIPLFMTGGDVSLFIWLKSSDRLGAIFGERIRFDFYCREGQLLKK